MTMHTNSHAPASCTYQVKTLNEPIKLGMTTQEVNDKTGLK